MALPKQWSRSEGVIVLPELGSTGQMGLDIPLNAVSVGHSYIHAHGYCFTNNTSAPWSIRLAWGVGVADAALLDPLNPNASPGAWLAWGVLCLSGRPWADSIDDNIEQSRVETAEHYTESSGQRRLDVGSPRFTAGWLSDSISASDDVEVSFDVSMLVFLQPAD